MEEVGITRILPSDQNEVIVSRDAEIRRNTRRRGITTQSHRGRGVGTPNSNGIYRPHPYIKGEAHLRDRNLKFRSDRVDGFVNAIRLLLPFDLIVVHERII